MTSARVNARNLLANWGAHGVNMVVLFFLSPFVVHTLGATEYGIWSLLNVLTGYMGMLDLGVRASTGRYVMLYMAKGDHAAVDRTIRTGLGFFSVAGLLLLAVGAVLGWVFPSFFSTVPEESRMLVQWLVPLMAINVWLSAFGAVLASVSIAHDRFDIVRGVDIVVLALRTAGTIFVLRNGQGLMGLVVVTLVSGAVGLLCNLLCARRIHPALRIWPLAFDRARLRELLGYGLAAFVGATAIRIIGQTDLVIVGRTINLQAVTVYSVGATLVYYTASYLHHIESVFFPPLQRAVTRGEVGDTKWLFFRQVRLAMIFGLPPYLGFIFFGESFIRLWMLGPEFDQLAVAGAAVVMAILAISKLPLLFTAGSEGFLAAKGHVNFNAVLGMTEALCNLGLSLLFVLHFRWGLAGVAGGTLAARLLVRTFVHPWYACRKLGVSWPGYLLRIGGALCVAGGGFAGICLLVRMAVPADNWGLFAAQVALALAGYLPIAWWLLVPSADRQRLVARLKARPARS